MPAFWIAAAGVVANVAGSASAAKGAKQSAAAQQQASQQIIKDTAAFQAQSFGLINQARSKGEGYLEGVQYIDKFDPVPFTRSLPPDDSRFVNAGINFSNLSYGQQTLQKRANLDFALGETQGRMRDAQSDFSSLAAGDTSAFTKEVQASAFGALADSAGTPTGAFANVSARNLFAFRTEGLRNSMAIADFFAEQGTVDPVDPLPSIFALAEFEQEEDKEKQALDQFNRTIDFETARHNSSLSLDFAKTGIGLEGLLLGTGVDVLSTGLDYTSNARLIGAQAAGAGAAANGQTLNAIGQGLSQLGGAYSDYSSGKSNNNTTSAYASFLGGSSNFSDFG